MHIELVIQPGYPDFKDLPLDVPLSEWQRICPRLEEVQRGISRHAVVFVNYSGVLFAIKELPSHVAHVEYENLVQINQSRIPSVIPIGYAILNANSRVSSLLFTCYLDNSLPYRSLFMRSNLSRYREHLLDAMAGLLVQLHLAGIYWGDCSLSNTLFRRDAGTLQAYLVDAETTEIHLPRLNPMLRHHDIEIMEENIIGDLGDLEATGHLPHNFPIHETGAYIRLRYRSLWEEVTREDMVSPDEHYRIQDRIRALNTMGFSVKDVEIQEGDRIRLRFVVTDRYFHREQLHQLTGVEAEDKQAQQMVNEIYEIKAFLSQASNRSVSLSAAAYHWLENMYQPVVELLKPLIARHDESAMPTNPVELYCQVLEHKWFLSERAHRDVGHIAAVEDYLRQFS